MAKSIGNPIEGASLYIKAAGITAVVLGAWETEHISGERMNTLMLCIAMILLNIVKAIYIINSSKDKTHSVDLLISGVFIGAFAMMMVELWS